MAESLIGTVPRWQLLGCDGPSATLPCRLIASARVIGGKLAHRMDREDLMHWPPLTSGTLTVEVTVDPQGLVIIDGPDWQACLAELQRVWQPAPPEAAGEITQGQRQIGSEYG